MTDLPKDAVDNPLTRRAWLRLDGWAGRSDTEVQVVGQTAQKWAIMPLGDKPVRLGGRNRWLNPGAVALVPRHAIRFGEVRS